MTRQTAIRSFLRRAGWQDAARGEISGDASFRRYERLCLNGNSAILMDAPPGKEDVRPFLAIARVLRSWGFAAPNVLGEDIDAGLLLLEDLGDDRFSLVIDRDPDLEAPLYAAAVDLLAALHDRPAPRELAISPAKPGAVWRLAPYDAGPLFAELHLFTDWYLPALRPDSDPETWRQMLDPPWQALIERLDAPADVLTLRDYHADNLMWRPERAGLGRIGLLDFQDALIGHPAYDLVSLLQDSRRDIPDALEAAMIERYLDGCLERGVRIDRGAFLRDYRILGAQRSAKVIGIFTRLARRDGKPAYLRHLPRVWRRLEGNLAEGGLSALEGVLDRLVEIRERRMQPRF